MNLKMRDVSHTSRYVAERSRYVYIDGKALHDFCNWLIQETVKVPPWDSAHHYSSGREDTVAYFLVLDSINFCFWPAEGKKRWEIRYKSGSLSGYNAMAFRLKNAMESGIPIADARFLAGMSLDEFMKILGGSGELQLLGERVEILHQLGQTLLLKYGGMPHLLVESAGKSAVRLVRLLIKDFSSFRDMAEYDEKTIYFYKRAQIFAADLHGAFGGKSWGQFLDMDMLTAFADYKLPQVLRQLGVINYTDSLSEKINNRMHLEPGSPEEVEIRANTVLAVEQIKNQLRVLGQDLRSFEIDWLLWNMGQDDTFREKPYHLTVSTYY